MTHRFLLHMDNMPVVQVWTTGTCKWPHMSLVRRFFFFLALRNLNLLLAHVLGCQNINADMLSRLYVEEFSPEHAGHCPYRRWFSLTFGSGFHTTSTAGKLRGCQHVTGLRVRAESVPGFMSGVGDPPPVPPPRVRAGAVCGPPGYAPFRGHPPHVRGRAAAFQLPFRLPDEGGGYTFSRVGAARPPTLTGRPLHTAA